MKSLIFIIAAIGVLCSALPAWANPETQAAFYNDCITQRIHNCHKKAMLKTSKSPCLKDCARINALQARFLQQNREKLVNDMLADNVKLKTYAVDYYLITTFFKSLK